MPTTKKGQDVKFAFNLYDEVIFNNISDINLERITSIPIHQNRYPIAFDVWRKSEVSRKDIRPKLLKFYCTSVTMLVHPYSKNKTHCFHRESILNVDMSFVGLYTLILISVSTIDVIIIPQLSSIAYSIHMGITLFQFIIGGLNSW